MRRFEMHELVRKIPVEIDDFNRIMGFDSSMPAPFDSIFEKVSSILQAGTARAEAVIFENNQVGVAHDKIAINSIEFHTGRRIASCLCQCDSAALFICTLGAEFENRMKSFQHDPVEAHFADTLGSLWCDALANIIHNRIADEVRKNGLSTTNRYSPGYCNWKVDEQKKLFSFFENNTTGIILNESSLMLPIKSISGLIGIGMSVKQTPHACDICADKNCFYRKKNTIFEKNDCD